MLGNFMEKCAHIKTQVLFIQIPPNFVLQFVNQSLAFNKRKFVQFVVILYLLFQGKFITKFENMRSLLELLKIKHYPKNHWCDNVGWVWLKITIPLSCKL